MSTRTMWKVTIAYTRIETREICASSADEAKELAEAADDGHGPISALAAEWIDPEMCEPERDDGDHPDRP